MLTFGLGSVAQFKFSKQDNPYAYSVLSVNFAFGFAVTCAALMVGKASG